MISRTIFSFVPVALALTLLTGCKKPEPVVLYCYCDETFWHLMIEESAAFRKVYDVEIALLPILPKKTEDTEEIVPQNRRAPIPWRSRPKIQGSFDPTDVPIDPGVSQLISSLNSDGRADLYLTDSVLQVDRLEESVMVANRYPICYLSLCLLVAKGNPLQIDSIAGLFDKKFRLGIMDPGKDGMGLTALEAIAPFSAGLTEDALESLVRRFDRHDELLDALENGEVDAVLAWNTVRPRDYLLRKYSRQYAEGKFKEAIDNARKYNSVEPMNRVLDEMFTAIVAEKQFADRLDLVSRESGGEARTIKVSLQSLGRTLHDGHCRRFADFLISPEGRTIMQRHGFVPKE